MGLGVGIAAGSELLGLGLQYGENVAARRRQRQAIDLSGQPLGATGLIQGRINAGQDSFLQLLRSNPDALKPFMFDTSSAFKALTAQDKITTADQVAGLSASTSSLGSRFGTGYGANEAMLRSRIAASLDARNAGISQSAFNTALSSGMQDFQFGQSNQFNLLQLLMNAQAGQRGQQLQALGMQAPGFGGMVGGTGVDIGQLLLLSQYLQKPGGAGAGAGGGAP